MPSPPSFNPDFYDRWEHWKGVKYAIMRQDADTRAKEAEGTYQRNVAEGYKTREEGGQVAPNSAAQRELQKAEAYLRKQMGLSEESGRNLTPEGADMLHRRINPGYYQGQGAQPGAGAVQPSMFSPTPIGQQIQQPQQPSLIADPSPQQPYVPPKIPVPGEEPIYHGAPATPYGGPSQAEPQSLLQRTQGQGLSVGQQIARNPVQTPSLLRPSTSQLPNSVLGSPSQPPSVFPTTPLSRLNRLNRLTAPPDLGDASEQPYRKGTPNVVPLRKGTSSVKGKGGNGKSAKSGGPPKGLEAILPALMQASQMGNGAAGPQAAGGPPMPMAPGAAAPPGFARGMPNVMHYQEGTDDTSSSVAPSSGGTSGVAPSSGGTSGGVGGIGGGNTSSVAPSGGGVGGIGGGGGVGGGGGDTHIYMPGAVHAPTTGPVSAAHTPLPQFGPSSSLNQPAPLSDAETRMYPREPDAGLGVQVAGNVPFGGGTFSSNSYGMPNMGNPNFSSEIYMPGGGGGGRARGGGSSARPRQSVAPAPGDPNRAPTTGPVSAANTPLPQFGTPSSLSQPTPPSAPNNAGLGVQVAGDPGRVPTGYYGSNRPPGVSIEAQYGQDVRDSDGWPVGIPRGGQFANTPGNPIRDFSEPIRIGRTGHVAGIGRPGSAPVYDVGGATYDVGRNGLPMAQQGQPGWNGQPAPQLGWQPTGRGWTHAPPYSGGGGGGGGSGGVTVSPPGPLLPLISLSHPRSQGSSEDQQSEDGFKKGSADIKGKAPATKGKSNGKGKPSNDLPKGLVALLPMLMAAAQGGGASPGGPPQAPPQGPGFSRGVSSVRRYDEGTSDAKPQVAPPPRGMGATSVQAAPPLTAPFSDRLAGIAPSQNIEDRRGQSYIPPSLGSMYTQDMMNSAATVGSAIHTAIFGNPAPAARGSLGEQAGVNQIPMGSRFDPLRSAVGMARGVSRVRRYDEGTSDANPQVAPPPLDLRAPPPEGGPGPIPAGPGVGTPHDPYASYDMGVLGGIVDASLRTVNPERFNQALQTFRPSRNIEDRRGGEGPAPPDYGSIASMADRIAREGARVLTPIPTQVAPGSLSAQAGYNSIASPHLRRGTPSVQPRPNYPFGAGYLFGATAVPGQGSGTVDKVPAMLAPHEAVLNRAAADMLGRGLISALNARGVRQMGMR